MQIILIILKGGKEPPQKMPNGNFSILTSLRATSFDRRSEAPALLGALPLLSFVDCAPPAFFRIVYLFYYYYFK